MIFPRYAAHLMKQRSNSTGFLKRISQVSPRLSARGGPSFHVHRGAIRSPEDHRSNTWTRTGVVTLLIIHSWHDKRSHDGYAAAEGVDTPAVINAGIMPEHLGESLHESHWYPATWTPYVDSTNVTVQKWRW